MDRLIPIIGRAPSEMPKEELLEVLQRERDRVRKVQEEWERLNIKKPRKGKKKAAKPKGLTPKKLDALCKQLGMTPQEIVELLKKQKEEGSE
jgi:DNA-binding Xre family transcriptional regulator